jgi:hypothetical protein
MVDFSGKFLLRAQTIRAFACSYDDERRGPGTRAAPFRIRSLNYLSMLRTLDWPVEVTHNTPERSAYATAWVRLRSLSRVTAPWITFLTVRSE